MPSTTLAPGMHITIEKPELQFVIEALQAAGFSTIGPTLREGAVVYDEISRIDQLPIGWGDEQKPGSYRLKWIDDDRYFGYGLGPHSWKKYLHPPRLKLFSTASNGSVRITPIDDAPTMAFIGVRACELQAMAIQDHIFLEGTFDDPHYRARRQRAFILAVNCTQVSDSCYCASMGSGPQIEEGFDLCLTELEDDFLIEIGSELGAEMVRSSQWQLAGAFSLNQAHHLLEDAEASISRRMDTSDLPQLLYQNLDHPRWGEVAKRCLSCMNCTMVCPTCFCTDVEDVADLTGANCERVRVWDSCFNPDFSYVHGGNLRPDTRSRYRQWMTHKLASWKDQFGSLGCVGCGRCITWCPAGIAMTEELAAIRGGVTPEGGIRS